MHNFNVKHLIISLGLSVSILTGCSDGGSSSASSNSAIGQVASAINELTTSGYKVAQGNIYLFQNTDCPLYLSIFGSCFGNNAAAPYLAPILL